MSLINRETDYALRILRSLTDGSVKSVSSICKEQEFTKPFAYKIIKKLENGEFVSIERGKQGGIKLCCEPEKKSLYDLMFALDNTVFINDCFKPGYKCEFKDKAPCCIHQNLVRIQSNLDKELKSAKLDKFF